MKSSVLMVVGSCLGQWKWIWFCKRSRNLSDFDVFDGASKSIYGALGLLFRTKARSLTAIGSIVMLLSVGYDAFFQQAVSYPLEELPNPVPDYETSIAYAQLYRNLDKNSTDYINLKAAIYDGAMYTNVSQTAVAVTASCPTGNCTFPWFASLGLCSKCVDISSKLIQQCEPATTGNSSGCVQNVSLPNGLYLINRPDLSSILNMTSSPSGFESFANVTPSQWPTTLSAIIVPNTITVKDQLNPTNGIDYFSLAKAYDCIFNYCVQAIGAAEFFGTYYETVVNTFFEDLPWVNRADVYDYTSYTLDRTWNETLYPTVDPMNTTFSVQAQGGAMIGRTLQEVLAQQDGYVQGGVTEFSKDIGEAIFHHGADMFPWSVANISTAVTNHIRLRSHEWVFGTAELRTPHVRFRWAWLLLPLAGLLATAVLLVATVYQTRRLRLPCWKASVLPSMQYGTKFVEAEEEGDAPVLVTVSRLSEYAATRRGTVKGQPVGLSVT